MQMFRETGDKPWLCTWTLLLYVDNNQWSQWRMLFSSAFVLLTSCCLLTRLRPKQAVATIALTVIDRSEMANTSVQTNWVVTWVCQEFQLWATWSTLVRKQPQIGNIVTLVVEGGALYLVNSLGSPTIEYGTVTSTADMRFVQLVARSTFADHSRQLIPIWQQIGREHFNWINSYQTVWQKRQKWNIRLWWQNACHRSKQTDRFIHSINTRQCMLDFFIYLFVEFLRIS